MTVRLRIILCVLCALLALSAKADEPLDPMAVLGAAKAATGGSAWNDLRYQHSRVTLATGGLAGTVERWSEFLTGRSYLRYELGPTSGAAGFDGTAGWTQDAHGDARRESGGAARELAVNAAYRDQLAFWFPARHPATIVVKSREHADDADFIVVAVTPQGGREFDLWINADTHLIERMTEREAEAMRTEYYMDFREVQGVRVPFRVRATRGDPRYDEIITIDALDFEAPATPVDFARPAPPPADYTFPAGTTSVEIPFTLANGHIYIDARFNGKPPVRLLLDTSGANVIAAESLKALGFQASAKASAGDIDRVDIATLDVGGIVLAHQSFASVPLQAHLARVEGVERAAGLIGYELFRRFPIRIDYDRQRITLYAPAQWKYDGGGVRVPLRFRQNVPTVDGSVDGLPGAFDLDTASRASLTLSAPFAAAHGLATKYSATTEVVAGIGVGGPARAMLARAQKLTLGDVAIPAPVTLLSTATSGALADPAVGGDVGYGVLSRFNLVFDYADQVVWFEQNAAFDARDTFDRAGLFVVRGKDGITVVDVVAGGPAAAAGIRSGDVVTTVDGTPAARITLDALRASLKAAPGTRIKLKLRNGRTSTLTLRDLV
ncbi:MAG TPA: PDZ domain-containing protein [Casimicrobiaceae bacterium]|nr:PDZ domain-containing protein [Casimicrobiaceae bacterium]